MPNPFFPTRAPKPIRFEATEIHTWFERDRAHVELRNKHTQETIFDVWDEDVHEVVENGFLNPRNWHTSVYNHAEYLGLLNFRR